MYDTEDFIQSHVMYDMFVQYVVCTAQYTLMGTKWFIYKMNKLFDLLGFLRR